MLKTILANLRRRKLRLLGTSVAVLLGVMFTSGTLVLTDSLNSAFDALFTDAYANTSAVVRSSKTIDVSATFGQGETRAKLPTGDVDKVAAVSGVAEVEPSVLGYTQIIGRNGKALGNPNQGPPTLGGNWPTHASMNPYQLIAGHAPETADQIGIDQQSSETTGYKVGDRIDVLTPTGRVTKQIVGIARFGDAKSAGGASAVFFTLAEAQKRLGLGNQIDEIHVVAKPGISEAEIVSRLTAAHIPDAEAITATEATAQTKKAATAFVGFFSTFLLVFGAIALLVGAFIIANTFSILVAQRTRELALLRALGASRRQVLGSVVAEAGVVGVLASVIGLGLGFLVATGLQKAVFFNGSGISPPVALTPRTVIASFAIGVGITVLSAILPARRASKVPPVTAMRDVALEDTGRGRIRAGVGLVFLALTVIFLALGVSGRAPIQVGIGALLGLIAAVVLGPVLAVGLGKLLGGALRATGGVASQLGQQNVLRNPKRTASTASALMIGATLVCAISVFAASAVASINSIVDTKFLGKVIVQSTGSGIPLSLVDELSTHKDLGTVAAFSFVPATVDDHPTLLTATDPAKYEKVVDLDVKQGSIASLGEDGVAVARTEADKRGYHLGDHLTVKLIDGSTSQFTIKAIYANHNMGGQIIGARRALERGMVAPIAQMALISGAPGVSAASVRDTAEKVAKNDPTAKVQTAAEFRESAAAQMNGLLNIIYAMLILAVIIAMIGIVNTLGLSILERTRELGLLRAVGMTRRQLRTAVRTEALIIALTGTIIGVVLGTAIGSALIKSIPADQGLTGFAVPPGRLIMVLVVGVLVGLIAAIWPARRAARLDPLEALATE